MYFLAMVIALLIERLLGDRERGREWDWFARYVRWVRDSMPTTGSWSGTLTVLVLVGAPSALTGLVYALLGGALLSLLALVFSVAVLVYCLGPRELDAETTRYINAVESGDDARADQLAHAIGGDVMPAGGAARNRALAEAVLLEFNDRTFGLLVWFVVLGPLGAVMYRLSSLARRDVQSGSQDAGYTDAVLRLHGILNWLPARLLALGYALAGSFEEAITDWRAYRERKSDLFWQGNLDLIAATGRGALRMSDAREADDGSSAAGLGVVRSALALILRTLVFWVVLFGLLTIAGFAI